MAGDVLRVGVGWVRFEPTPGQRAGAVPSYTRGRIGEDGPSRFPSRSTVAPPQSNRIDETTAPAGSRQRLRQRVVHGPGPGAGRGGRDARPAGPARPPPRTPCAGSARGGGAPRTPPRRWPRRPGPSCVTPRWTSAWPGTTTSRSGRGLARPSVRFGAPGGEEDALARTSVRGPGVNPDAEESLVRLVELVERARYARDLPAGAVQVDAVRADLDACVAALEAGAGKRRRTQATWLPRSLWARWVSAPGQRARDEALLGDAASTTRRATTGGLQPSATAFLTHYRALNTVASPSVLRLHRRTGHLRLVTSRAGHGLRLRARLPASRWSRVARPCPVRERVAAAFRADDLDPQSPYAFENFAGGFTYRRDSAAAVCRPDRVRGRSGRGGGATAPRAGPSASGAGGTGRGRSASARVRPRST